MNTDSSERGNKVRRHIYTKVFIWVYKQSDGDWKQYG